MAFLERLKHSVKAVLQTTGGPSTFTLQSQLQLELSRELSRLRQDVQATMPGNPAGHGYKVYSQADEDGILAHILARLGLATGSFAEIGCGDGRENNTHFLLLNGWRGIWIDGDHGNIEAIRAALPASSRLQVVQAYVTQANIRQLLQSAVTAFGSIEVQSIDVDGNDLPLAQAAVEAVSPRVLVVEYNAKFPYPTDVGVAYDPDHRWQTDDYHGASLGACVAGLAPDYRLVSCNLAGTNAFFVRREDAHLFGNNAPEVIYQPARFHLTALQAGHRPTLKFLAAMLARESAGNRS